MAHSDNEKLKEHFTATENWNLWKYNKRYGYLFYKRATGELEEMESSKALCHVISKFYKSGMRVADIGCGAGHYLRSLRERIDANIDYTGIDATEYYIELARKAYPEGAIFKVGDILDIPAEKDSYDLVICNNVILHLPPPPVRAFAELLRIAKKFVVIRTVFGVRTYIIQEVLNPGDGYEELEQKESQLIRSNVDLSHIRYFNLYTESYVREAIRALDPTIEIDIIKDDMWNPFDNRDFTTETGTVTFDNKQISGNIVLDWRFIVLTYR